MKKNYQTASSASERNLALLGIFSENKVDFSLIRVQFDKKLRKTLVGFSLSFLFRYRSLDSMTFMTAKVKLCI